MGAIPGLILESLESLGLPERHLALRTALPVTCSHVCSVLRGGWEGPGFQPQHGKETNSKTKQTHRILAPPTPPKEIFLELPYAKQTKLIFYLYKLTWVGCVVAQW